MFIGALAGDNSFLGGVEGADVDYAQSLMREGSVKLLVLWGGEDISPSLYNEPVHRAHAPALPSQRDLFETDILRQAIDHGVPILGICRGAQLLCANQGGRLWQHVDNHGSSHDVILQDGSIVKTNSCHHQMMVPSGKHLMLGWTENRSPKKWNASACVEDLGPEPEIVLWPKIKALGIQGHPEWVVKTSDFYKLTVQLLKEHLNVSLSDNRRGPRAVSTGQWWHVEVVNR